MSNKVKKALIAGGGTGGHLFPALSIGNELEKNNVEVQYIGSYYGIEKDFLMKKKCKFHLLNITGIQRNFSIKSIYMNLFFPFRFLISYLKSIYIIKKINPSIIIGTGGYVSGLPLIAGIQLKIPTVIQDQNSIPGLITKKLHNKVDKVFLAYSIANKKLNKNKCIISGNPIRHELVKSNRNEALKKINFDTNKKTILILGGSQGSSPINKYFKKNIDYFNNNNLQLIWQCGNYDYKNLEKIKKKNILIKPFFNNISQIYSASDIIISRAGAITISELTYMSKAIILIPYPQAAENHQKINAEYISDNKACQLIDQNDLGSNKLINCIDDLLKDKKKIKELEQNAKKISKPNATKNITNHIMELIK
tara:strand:- start:720 stop:1817 length:1098 start_codon:yes stop_codon:yes gene_type:complete